jgi:putative lipoic acid-binding regulatory protein
MTDKNTLIEFPCHFPIKIIGKNSAEFATEIKAITLKHFPETPEAAIVCQESQKGNYLSITVTIYVHTQDNLDALYKELTKHPDIKMVL